MVAPLWSGGRHARPWVCFLALLRLVGDARALRRVLDYEAQARKAVAYLVGQGDPSVAFEWCTAGYGLQLNKGSLLGHFGPEPQRTANLLLEHRLAACVASDAHSPRQRNTHMGEVRRLLHELCGENFTHLLLEDNPSRILAGKPLLGLERIPFW